MTIISVPLGKLQVSPLNVRTNKEAVANTAALEASILAFGLLEPLIAHPLKTPKGHYGVYAGGKRLRSLQALQKRGDIPADYQAEVVVRDFDDGRITEASAAENLIRENLRPYEIYAAYRNAVDRGVSPQDLAAHFGQRQIYVDQILRLGRLHPLLFAELEAGRLSDDQARAYAATEDQELQLAVFSRMSKGPKYDHHPNAIRSAMKVGDRDSARFLRFVGQEAYEAAGGRWERDLFEEADNRGRVVDEQLLARLVEEKMAVLRESTVARANRGVAWAARPPTTGGQFGYTDYSLQIEPRKSPLSAELKAEKEELEQKKVDIEDMARRVLRDEAGKARPGMEKEQADLDAEYRPIIDGLDAIDAGRRWILPKGGEIVFTLDVDSRGEPDLKFWWASRKILRDVEKARAAGRPSTADASEPAEGDDGDAPVSPAAVQPDLSQTGVIIMKEVRRSLMRALLVEDAQRGGGVAQDYLVWSQLRGAIFHGNHQAQGEIGAFTLSAGHYESLGTAVEAADVLKGSPSHEIWQQAVDLLKSQSFLTARNLGGAFIDFQMAPPETKALAAAVVAGLSLKRSLNFRGMGMDVHDVVANATGRAHPNALRRISPPSAALIDLRPKAKRLAFIESMVDRVTFASWSKKKAGEITDLVLKVLTGRSPALKSSAVSEAKDWIDPLLSFGRPNVLESAGETETGKEAA